ncbi:hypothetical protein KEM48_009949 [Puccinia striiformis f. sp. tritici PST-130]|nr:hypothetical protein KEM48_009949 [Puccinia striiformis f. sp. tritici PST-130]
MRSKKFTVEDEDFGASVTRPAILSNGGNPCQVWPYPGDFGTLEASKLPSVRLELGRTGLDVTPDLSFPANDRGGLPSGLQPTTQSNDNVRFQRWHGPGSTWTGFEPIDFLGNPRKRPLAYLPEEPPRSWSPDLLESQHRNNLGISIPPQPPNNCENQRS